MTLSMMIHDVAVFFNVCQPKPVTAAADMLDRERKAWTSYQDNQALAEHYAALAQMAKRQSVRLQTERRKLESAK